MQSLKVLLTKQFYPDVPIAFLNWLHHFHDLLGADPHYRMKWRANLEESLRNRSAGSVPHLESDPTHPKQTPRCWRTLALAHFFPGIILRSPLALGAIPPPEQKGL